MDSTLGDHFWDQNDITVLLRAAYALKEGIQFLNTQVTMYSRCLIEHSSCKKAYEIENKISKFWL
jgi:hypothetical protein